MKRPPSQDWTGTAACRERGGVRRLLASCLITAGVIVLGIAGVTNSAAPVSIHCASGRPGIY